MNSNVSIWPRNIQGCEEEILGIIVYVGTYFKSAKASLSSIESESILIFISRLNTEGEVITDRKNTAPVLYCYNARSIIYSKSRICCSYLF